MRTDYSLLIFFLGVFVFQSPLNHWWASIHWPWYTIFLPWLILVILCMINQRQKHRGD